MNQEKVTPVFQLFEQQLDNSSKLFTDLSKQFKTKKAIELEEKLIFLEIYIQLLSKIHFEEKDLKFKLFSPFKKLFKLLKKVLHLKLIREALADKSHTLTYGSFENYLLKEKSILYTEIFDHILSLPGSIWEDLYMDVRMHSTSIKPLMVNTATTQIINEELEFSYFDSLQEPTAKSIKDIYESLQIIIAIENFRMISGLNAVFTPTIHDDMNDLSKSLYSWYQNHLLLQQLTHFFSEKEMITEKYKNLIQDIKKSKKKLTTKVISQSKILFTERLH
ncbi:hypothetical protein [Anditalea andensis]|uniref:Uncharacterized protein n=1 Tax=Anditalea andensis TaxID=1048983 RepID=A0A074LM12_9BACT|nr:hypothetical protein [Anditalea andensis]KEO74927.1 hypothetical protein EL17_04420 [Anditalea andensis]